MILGLVIQVTEAQGSAVRTRGISFLCVRVRLGRSDMVELL